METEFVRDNYNAADDSTIKRLSRALWEEIKTFLEKQDIKGSYLDAGCGTGRYLEYAASLGVKNLTGFDNSKKMIAQSKSRFPVHDTDAHLYVCDIRETTKLFPPSSFDMITCTAVIPHIQKDEDRRSVMCDLIRLLKPGGELLVCVWAKDTITDARILSKMEKSKETDSENDYLVTLEGKQWYYYMFSKQEFQFFVMECCRLLGKGLMVKFFQSHDNYFAQISKTAQYHEL